MKVYFDEFGELRHHGCCGQIKAEIEVRFPLCPIDNSDGDWDFGEFEAHVDLGSVEDYSSGDIVSLTCQGCYKTVGYAWTAIELVSGEEDG